MAKETNIKNALLKLAEPAPDTDAVAQILARDTARVKRLKWVVIVCWLLVMILFVVAGIVESNTKGAKGAESNVLDLNTVWVSVAAIVIRAMLLIAVVLTISLYIRSRTLTMHQIQTRLANIEEQLMRMSQDKSSASET